MKSPEMGMDEPEKNMPKKEKEFQFDLDVRSEELWDALYKRDIDADWNTAKRQILENISKFLQERGRRVDAVEMQRIDEILENAEEEFKNPGAKMDEYPSGTLTRGMDKLQEAIAEELNKRE